MVDVDHELELARLHREPQHDERERETTRRGEEPANGNDERTERPEQQQPGTGLLGDRPQNRLGAPGTPTLRLPTEEKTHLTNNNLNEHQLRQEVRRLPPHHVNSRRARHAAPSCGLLRLQLRPTTTTTHALRPALSPPPPPLRLTDPPWAWFELSDGRGRRARGTLLPPRTVYPDRNSLKGRGSLHLGSARVCKGSQIRS